MKTPYEDQYKKYTYKDNSKTGKGKVVFECVEKSLISADLEFIEMVGYDPSKEKYIGCSVEII